MLNVFQKHLFLFEIILTISRNALINDYQFGELFFPSLFSLLKFECYSLKIHVLQSLPLIS